ncbi:MAG: hypothetical protein ABI748_12130 [Dokdonella sp.]
MPDMVIKLLALLGPVFVLIWIYWMQFVTTWPFRYRGAIFRAQHPGHDGSCLPLIRFITNDLWHIRVSRPHA